MTADSSPSRSPADSLRTGFLLGLLLIVLSQAPALIFGLMWILFFGATQLLGILPAAIYVGVKRRWATFKGLLLIAGIAILLNSICTVVVMTNLEFH